jgi:uncharacterized protein YpuA (DUF1002 family)
MQPPLNGASPPPRPWWWLVGAVLAPVTLACFGNLLHTAYSSAQRVSSLEATYQVVRQQLQRIEDKLDRFLEKRE